MKQESQAMEPKTDELVAARDPEYIEVSFERAAGTDDGGIIFTDGQSNYYSSTANKGTNCCNCDKG